MIPMFGQSWSVFAPNPINGDYRLEIRATILEDGEPVQTDWIDATTADLTMHMYRLFPARAGMVSTDVASRFKGAWDALNDDQKEIVELGYYKGDDWRDRMEEALRAHGNIGAVERYMEMERIAVAYSTQVAYALWGDDVQHIQFLASRQNVIPYAQRNDPDAVRPGVQPVPVGWRGMIELEGQSRENFANTFLRGFENSGQVR